MKPIGYFVSVPEGHPDFEILKKLENDYGSYFQVVPLSVLKTLLHHCVGVDVNEFDLATVFELFERLTLATAFELTPFLYQVIKARLEESNAN